MPIENIESQPSPEEQPEEGQPIEQKKERKPEEIIREFEAETESMKKRIEGANRKIDEYQRAEEENLRMAKIDNTAPSFVDGLIARNIARNIDRLKEETQELVKDVEKRGPSQEEQKIKVEIRGIDAHIKIIQKVEEQDVPGEIKEGRKRNIRELEKQKKEKEKKLREETLKRIEEYQKEKEKPEGMPISEKGEPEGKPEEKQPEAPKKIEEAPRLVVADALDRKIEETKGEVDKLKERAPEGAPEGVEKSEETAKLQELAALEKQRQQEVERITGRNFSQETRDELVKEGYYIDKEGKRWRVRRIPKENAIRERIERIGKAERSQVFKNQWEKLSDQEKAGYGDQIENFINKLEQQRRTLSRQTGVEISQDIFCQFLNSGKLKEVEKTSILGLFRKRIIVPIKQEDGAVEMKKYSVKEFKKLVGFNQKRIEERRREKAEEKWQRGQGVLAKAVAERVEKKTEEALEDIRNQELVKKFWEKAEAEPREKREKEEEEARQKHQERSDKLKGWEKRINSFLKKIGAGALEDIEKGKKLPPGFEEVAIALAQYQKKQKTIEQNLQEELRRIEQNFKDEVEKLRKQKVSEILQLEELKKI